MSSQKSCFAENCCVEENSHFEMVWCLKQPVQHNAIGRVWKFDNHSHLPRVARRQSPLCHHFPGYRSELGPKSIISARPCDDWWCLPARNLIDWSELTREERGLVGIAHAISVPESSSGLQVFWLFTRYGMSCTILSHHPDCDCFAFSLGPIQNSHWFDKGWPEPAIWINFVLNTWNLLLPE